MFSPCRILTSMVIGVAFFAVASSAIAEGQRVAVTKVEQNIAQKEPIRKAQQQLEQMKTVDPDTQNKPIDQGLQESREKAEVALSVGTGNGLTGKLGTARLRTSKQVKAASALQKKVNEDEKKEQQADDSLKRSRDHQQAVKDAIKKSLDQSSEASQAVQSLGR